MQSKPVCRISALAVWSLAMITLLGTLVVSSDVADAESKKQIPAPFGLEWGWTHTDLAKSGIKISSNERAKSNAASILRIYNTPQEIAGSRYVLVLVTDSYGIQRVLWSSPTFRNDKTGSKGKARYSELKSALTDKYGPSNSYEWFSKTKEFSNQIDDFYKCIEIKGCGAWSSYWTKDFVGSIRLYISGLKNKSEGYVSLRYEGPKFGQYLYDIKKRKEKGAL